MDERALDNIVEDICLFLMKHVIPREGKYHDDESQLSKPQFWVLIEISKLKHTKEGYQRTETNFDVYMMCDDTTRDAWLFDVFSVTMDRYVTILSIF